MAEIKGNVSRTGEIYRVTLSANSDFNRKKIWSAISQPDALASWLGRVSGPILLGEPFTVTYPNDTDYSIVAKVRDRRVPSMLELSWKFNDYPENFVRITLSKRPEGGTEVRLVVSGLDRDSVVMSAATWHTQMEFLRNYLEGREVLGHALRFRRDELTETYERQLEEIGAPRVPRRGVRFLHPRNRENRVEQVMHRYSYLA